MGCTDATAAFQRAVTKAEELARTFVALNTTQGVCGSTVKDAHNLGSAVGSLAELGFAGVEIAKVRASHQFLEKHPAEDFDVLVQHFEESAAATLGIAQ